VSTCPSVQVVEAPLHALQSLHAPHAQPLPHKRVRCCVPVLQFPQARISVPACPGVHALVAQLALAPASPP
jgi:hypothetical protein